jgi:hypothetical protein
VESANPPKDALRGHMVSGKRFAVICLGEPSGTPGEAEERG